MMRLPTVAGRVTLLVCLALAAHGCGGETTAALPAGGGDVPVTSRAIAAVAFEHVPRTEHVGETWVGADDPAGTVGAELRYGADGESDGDLLRVVVAPAREGDLCQAAEARCEQREVEDGTLVLRWDLVEPEEDPGYVAVALQRDDEVVSAMLAGDEITGHPREQRLRVSVATMEELVQDERLGLTTSQAAVDAGDALDDWEDDR